MPPESCKICEQPAQGRHFGVVSCRACAAFFRRAAKQKTENGDKGSEEENCTIFENGSYKCKKCRLRKCFDEGMSTDKFQKDRDPLSSTSSYKKRIEPSPPQSLTNFLGRPEFILSCEPDRISPIKTILDVSYLIQKAVDVFQKDSRYSCLPYHFGNSLEKLTFAMEYMKINSLNQPVEVVKYIGQIEYMMFWEKTFMTAAQWFAEIPEFAELDLDVKLEILKSTWMLRARLEKLAETADYQRKKLMNSGVFMLTDESCLNLGDVEVDLKWCTNYSTEQMRFYLMPDSDQHWQDTVDALIQLEPTSIELNFMLIHLCLTDAGRRNQGRILEETDRLLQIQSDNLHDYYTKKLKMPYYSGRLAKMMKVNKLIGIDVRRRREKNHLAKIFDIFSVEFSHPEMFELT